MEPIFSRDAQTVGWFKDDVVYGLTGKPRAFVLQASLFAYNGSYLGRLEYGYFRDRNGHAVAFLRGASGKPTTPAPRVVPNEPFTGPRPPAPAVRVVPKAHSPSIFWSDLDMDALLQPIDEEPRPPAVEIVENLREL